MSSSLTWSEAVVAQLLDNDICGMSDATRAEKDYDFVAD
jgi:hypothetical protein